jgi:hypothetical protein
MRSPVLKVALAGLTLTLGGLVRAEDAATRCPCFFHRHFSEGTPPPGKARHIAHTDERAGYPRALSGHLVPSATRNGIGYCVGGGVAYGRGRGRGRDDGAWGWDETGYPRHRRRVILGWSQGRLYQGGTGAYATDGPVVPDLIYATTTAVNSLGRRRDEE